MLWADNGVPRSTGCLENVLELWLLLLDYLKVLEVLALLLLTLTQLHVDGVELLLEGCHSAIQIGVDFLLLSDDDAFGALTTCGSLGATAGTDCNNLILVEVRHHLSLVPEISIFLLARCLLALLTLSIRLLTHRLLTIGGLSNLFLASPSLLIGDQNVAIVVGGPYSNDSIARISIVEEWLLPIVD